MLAGFSLAHAAGARERASATVRGQAFGITLRGDVKHAGGATIWLYPVTPLTTEWHEAVVRHGRQLPLSDPRMRQLARMESADLEGRFEFRGLPPGDYYVVSLLSAGVKTGYAMQPRGIVLHNQVHVEAGETQRVSLTAHVQPGVGFR
ncbi:MAG TPA: hypothetical protein VF551_04155 [Chthoniobacterales bacterium]